MKIFDPHITGSLSVSASAEIQGDLIVSGTIYGTAQISGQVQEAVSASHAAEYTLTSSFEAATSSLSSSIATEKDRVDAILLASDADKDSFKEIVDLINSVDTTNDQAFASFYTSSNDRLDSVETFTGSINTTIKTKLNTEQVVSGSEFVLNSTTPITQYVDISVTQSGGRYYIDGVQTQIVSLAKGLIYRFDVSDTSNSGHPFRLSTTDDGTHGGGSDYTDGVTVNGTEGNDGAYVQIIVNQDTPQTLYYYCTNHGGMGSTIFVGGAGDTDSVSEGSTNLYYTDARVKTKLNSENVISGSEQVILTGTTGYSDLNTRLGSIESFTGSIDDTFATDGDVTNLRNDLNTYSSSTDGRLDSLETESGSIRTDFNNFTSSVPFEISGSDILGNTYDKSFTRLQFDDSTGLNVSEPSAGTAFVSLGSHFKDIFIDGEDILRATGSDELEITSEGGIVISTSLTDTNANGYSKELKFSVSDLSSSLDGRIDGLTGDLNTYTSSNNSNINALQQSLSSLEIKTGSLDQDVSDINDRLDSLETTSGSHDGRLDSIESFTASIDDTFATDGDVTNLRDDLNAYTSSNDGRLNALETKTGSLDSTNTTQNNRISSLETESGSIRGDFNTYTSSNDTTNTTQNSRLSALETNSGSQAGEIGDLQTFQDTVEAGLEFTGSNVTIKGDLLVKGTETRVDSTTVEISDNIISLNGSGAANAGLEVRDVTAPDTVSGSLLWDGARNYWIGGPKGNEERLLDDSDLTVITGRLGSLETESGSIRTTFNSYTSSNDTINTNQNSRLGSLETKTGSLEGRVSSLETTSGSHDGRLDSIESFTASIDDTFATDGDVTNLRNDLNTYTSSNDGRQSTQDGRLDSLESVTGSYTTTDYYTTGATFNTSDGVITGTRNDGGTWTVDIDGRYLTGYTESDTLDSVADRGNTTNQSLNIGDYISMTSGQPKVRLYENDTTNQNKEIIVSGGRLYIRNLNDNGTAGSNLFNLDGSGNGSFTAGVSATSFVKSGGTSAQFLKADGSVDGSTYLTAHPSVSAASSSDNSGRTYIQDILLDSFGHITGLTTATETVTNTDEYTTGATFNNTSGVLTFTRNDGDQYTVDLSDTLSEITVTGGTYDSNTQTLTLTKSDGNSIDVSGFAVDTDVNWYLTGATFSGGTLSLSVKDYPSSPVTVSLDGRYSLTTHNHDSAYVNVGGDTMTGDLIGPRFYQSQHGTPISNSSYAAEAAVYANANADENVYPGYGFHKSGVLGVFLYATNRSTLRLRGDDGNDYKLWHDGNLTNLNQLTNGPGYITGYTETQTLDAVTDLGSTTTNSINVGGVTTTSTSGPSQMTFFRDENLGTSDTIAQINFQADYQGSPIPYGRIDVGSNSSNVRTDIDFYVKSTSGNLETALKLQGGSAKPKAFFYNSVSAPSFVKDGGTSAQFLMADGSVSTNPGWITGYTNTYLTGATFSTANGIITFTKNDGNTVTVDIDGKYAEAGHTHNVYDLNNFSSGADPDTYAQTRIWTSYNGGTVGNYPSSYNGVVNFGMDASHGMQLSYHYGATDDALYFRHKSDNPSAPNGVGWQGWQVVASRAWVSARGYLTSYNNYYTTGATLSANVATFTRNDGGTYTVDLNALVDVTVTGGTYNDGTATLRLNKSDGNSFDVTGFTIDTNTYITGHTFSGGTLTSTRNNGTSVTVSLDGRYLLDTTDTFTGALSIDGDIRGTGQQLILNAGESYLYATGQTNEYIYLNAEQGVEINSETGNWTTNGWADRKTALLRGDLLRLDGENLTKTDIQNFKTAYGWGNHANTYLPLAGGTLSGDLDFSTGHGRDKIDLNGSDAHTFGTESYHNTYGPNTWNSGTIAHKFYANANTVIATIGTGGNPGSRDSVFYGKVTLESSTSGSTIFDIQGTSGQLFSITDDLTGDIFAVSDASGVPILNVNADGTVKIDPLGSLYVGNNKVINGSGNIEFDGPVTTTNQGRGIYWTGYDKETTTDLSDNAHILHTTNSGGLTGSVIEIKSHNDATDGVNFVVNATDSGVRINGNAIATQTWVNTNTLNQTEGDARYAQLSASNSFTNSYNEFGNDTGNASNDGSWAARVNVVGANHSRLDVRENSDGIITTMYSHVGNGAGKMGTMSNHPIHLLSNGSSVVTIDQSGNAVFNGTLSASGYNNTNWDTAYTYSQVGHLPLAGGSISGYISFTGNGTNTGIRFNNSVVANDAAGIRQNGTSNAGELEFFTTDDDNEPFVFRHYTTGQDGSGSSVEWFRIGAGGAITAAGNLSAANFSGSHSGTSSGTNTGDQTNVSGYAGTLYREDNRTISPSELSAGYLKFGFTSFGNNNTSPWADFIHMRGYTDASGGADNLLVFRRTDGIEMRIYQQTYGSSTAYSEFRRVAMTRATSFSNVSSVTFNHGLLTEDLTAQVFDSSGNMFFPSNIQITSTQVIVTFATNRSGRLVVVG